MDRLYYPEDFAFYEIHNNSITTLKQPKTKRKSLERRESDPTPSKKVKHNTRSSSLPRSTERAEILQLPQELNELLLKATAKSMLLPSIVEIHEEELEVSFKYADDQTTCKPEQRKIKHLRSVTRPPTLQLEHREHKAKFAKRFFDKNNHLGHELCPDRVPFDFKLDSAYFTLDTLKSWMPFWGKCSQLHPDFPLNDEAGIVLRQNLRHIVLDVKLVIGKDIFSGFKGNETNLEELSLGLATFPSLETITLVVDERDADVHLEHFNSNEDTSWEESVYNVKELFADKGVESIELTNPQNGTNSAAVLQVSAAYLRGGLEYFWNEYERPITTASFRPPTTQRKIQTLPAIRTMLRKPQ